FPRMGHRFAAAVVTGGKRTTLVGRRVGGAQLGGILAQLLEGGAHHPALESRAGDAEQARCVIVDAVGLPQRVADRLLAGVPASDHSGHNRTPPSLAAATRVPSGFSASANSGDSARSTLGGSGGVV